LALRWADRLDQKRVDWWAAQRDLKMVLSKAEKLVCMSVYRSEYYLVALLAAGMVVVLAQYSVELSVAMMVVRLDDQSADLWVNEKAAGLAEKMAS